MRYLGFAFPAGDRWLLAAYLLLCVFSLALLWSVTEGIRGPYADVDPGVPKTIFWRQLIWVLVGWVSLVLAARIPLRHLENLAVPTFLLSLLLLALTLVLAPKVGGAHRWLVLGPLHMQPSEMAKIAYILMMAHLLGGQSGGQRQLGVTILSLIITAIPFILVLREPDLGTSLVFPALWIGMIFWFGISGVFMLWAGTSAVSGVIAFYSESVVHNPWPWAVFLLLVLGLLYLGRFGMLTSSVILATNIMTGIGIPFVWDKLALYQQERILTFFDPSRDAFGSGYQAIQSKVAIGSGGLFGTHYLQGTQKGLAFLPERHTDFIFSVAGEELGFAGAVVLLALFLVIILRCLQQAMTTRGPFGVYLAVGAATYFTFHVVVNVAITTGLLPVTGLPLPLISYGGSNLLVSSVLLGLVLNVSSRQFES